MNLNAQDKNHWTALHHLVAPLDYGTYDNIEILKMLVDNGANLNAVDEMEMKPLDQALMRGAHKLSKAIQKLLKIPLTQWVRLTKSSGDPSGALQV